MEKRNKCVFFGHSNIEINDELEKQLTQIITFQIINQNFLDFIFGGFGGFDDLCYKIVSSLKETYPQIKRIFCLYDRTHLNPLKLPKWIKEKEYEELIYLEPRFNGWYKRIYFRNLEMIDFSDLAIFYVKENPNSGAYKTFKYALRKKKNIINLYNEKG